MKPLEGFDFAALKTLLAELRADAWLLYDFRGINPAATRVLGIHGMGTRRFFALLPREGKAIALAHRIELAAFDGFPGEVRPYAAWPELHEQLRALVGGKSWGSRQTRPIRITSRAPAATVASRRVR